MKKTSCKQGFTLIELLVVVLIIGILAAVAVPQYQKAVDKSHAVTVLNVLKALQEAQEVYYLANGQYATNFDDLDVEIPGGKLKTNTDSRRFYEDGSGYYMYISDNGTQSVKGTPKGLVGETDLEFYLEHHSVSSISPAGSYIQCTGRTLRGQNICKGLGGEYFRTHSNNTTIFYILHL